MTTSSYSITLDDSEYITLKPALEFYLEHCEKEFAENPRAPYWAHAESCKTMLEKLKEAWDKKDMTSTTYILGDE